MSFDKIIIFYDPVAFNFGNIRSSNSNLPDTRNRSGPLITPSL